MRSLALVPLFALAAGCTGAIDSDGKGGRPAEPGAPGTPPGSGMGPGPGPSPGAPPGAGPVSPPGVSPPPPGPPLTLPDAGAATDASASADSGAPGMGGTPDAGAPPSPPSVPPCSVTIVPITPPRLADLLAVPDARLRIQAVASGPMAPQTPAWKWLVQLQVPGGNSQPVPVSQVNGDQGTVEFPVHVAGIYNIRAEATPTCFSTGAARSVLPAERQLTFWLRVTPPRTSELVPFETPLPLGRGSVPVRDVALQAGYQVNIDPQDASKVAIPSYIRISSARSSLRFEGHNKVGAFTTWLDPARSYDILLIPDGNVAPALIPSILPSQLAAQPARLMLDQGTLVEGRVLQGPGAGAAPLEGARVLLRASGLSSTIGRSDASGAFALRARPASFSALVLPPPDRGLTEAQLPEGRLITVGNLPLDIVFRWNAPATGRLDVQVVDSAGQPFSRPTRVRIESEPGALPDVGSFEIGANERITATGYLRMEVAAAGGVASFSRVPRARYRVTALPAAEVTDAAVGSTVIDAAGAGPFRVTLDPVVTLRGRLLPTSLSAGLQVVAFDPTAPAGSATASATVGSDGAFALAVAPGRSYRLLTEPAPERRMPRLLIGVWKLGTTDLAIADQTLKQGLALTGRITDRSMPVAGTVIQVYCTGTTSDCVDPEAPNVESTRPVGEAISDGTGRYQVYVPDPAQWNL